MNKLMSMVVLPSALLGLLGCSYAPYRTADLSQNPAVARWEVMSPPDAQMIHQDVDAVHEGDDVLRASEVRRHRIQGVELEAGDTFSVKYHRSLFYPAPNVSIPVEFPNGREYVAYLDTGYAGNVLVTGDVVLANELPIRPVEGGVFSGACRISELKVGSACLEDATAEYDERQWQLRILNVPVYRHPAVILGLGFISSFDYVLFDNVNEEVVFSRAGAFQPANPELWRSYRFQVGHDRTADERIIVLAPINGLTCPLVFDSCGHEPGLILRQAYWRVVERHLQVERLRQSHYYKYQDGRLPCQIATVSNMSIGETVLSEAEILIPDDPESTSLISLSYFQDTVVVLDFVNKLLWIRS